MALKTGAEHLEQPGVTWFDANWMFAAIPLALLVLVRMLSKHAPSSIAFLAWALTPIYILHQFEEHAWDWHGRRYHFITYFNAKIEKMLDSDQIQLTPRLVTNINVPYTYFAINICAAKAEMDGDYFPSAVQWGLATANGLGAHIIIGIKENLYNPGAIQSCFMVPVGLYFFNQIRKMYGIKVVILCLILGGPVGHVLGIVVPIYLRMQGTLNDFGFAAWVSGTIIGLPLLLSPLVHKYLATPKKLKD